MSAKLKKPTDPVGEVWTDEKGRKFLRVNIIDLPPVDPRVQRAHDQLVRVARRLVKLTGRGSAEFALRMVADEVQIGIFDPDQDSRWSVLSAE